MNKTTLVLIIATFTAFSFMNITEEHNYRLVAFTETDKFI